MALRYVTNFWSNLDVYFEPLEDLTDPATAAISATRNRVLKNSNRLVPLIWTMEDFLKKAKVVCDPTITIAHYNLSANPREAPYFDPPPFLYIDIPYDPMDLEHLTIDTVHIGKMSIDFVEQALAKLEASPGFDDFPFQVIRDACAAFEAAGYSYTIKVTEQMLPGTKIKGRIDLQACGAETKRNFTASYRGKQLLQKTIHRDTKPELLINGRFHGFAFEHGMIHFMKSPIHEWEEASGIFLKMGDDINIRDYPELREICARKGWFSA